MPGRGSQVSERLLRRSAWRYAQQHPWQIGLSFIGVVLGVMMIVAVDLANSSAKKAFAISIESVTGNISHQIVGGSDGLSDSVFTALRTELGIRSSAPNISGQVLIKGKSFTLLGVDALSEAGLQRRRPGITLQGNALGGDFFSAFNRSDAVLLAENAASSLGLSAGDTFTISTGRNNSEAYLTSVFASNNSAATKGLVFADIAVAQVLLKSEGTIDSIDLILNDKEIEQVRQWLPANLTLVDAQTRTDSLEQMTEAFHINLLAMSLLSLLVAGLLIYNTVTLSVIQRQSTLGIFRSQGVSRAQIFKLALGEAALLGFVASIVGLVLGFGFGQLLVQLVSRTIDDLYFSLSVTSFLIDPLSLLKGFMLGVGITLCSAGLPAWRATHSPPVTLQQRVVMDQHWQKRLPLLAFIGMSMMIIGALMLLPEQGSLVAGFVALTLLIFGFCFLVPAIMNLSLGIILKIGASFFGISTRMALRNIQSGISRTGLAVAALTVAISVTVGVGVMVGSFRDTVILWLDQSLGGDIQISATDSGEENTSVQLRLIQGQLLDINNVESVNSFVLKRVESELGQVRITVSGLPASQSYYLKESSAQSLQDFNQGQGILISEPLAYRHELEMSDSVLVYTDSGAQLFPIVGIFYDYTSNLGMLGLHQSLYEKWWEGSSVSRLTLTSSDPGSISSVMLPEVRNVLAQFINEEGRPQFFALSNRELRDLTLNVFDRTFAITNVLRLLAILVAFVGVLSAMMALQLERLREFGILRATGMTPRQIIKQILAQTAVMGLCAGLLSVPLGLIMSEVLIDVINRRSFGWSMQHVLPESVLLEALVLAIVAALIAGVYPAIRAARTTPAVALRSE